MYVAVFNMEPFRFSFAKKKIVKVRNFKIEHSFTRN